LADPGSGNGSGTLVEFKDQSGKLLNAVIVGKRHLRPQSQSDPFRLKGLFDGCYVRLPSDPENVLLISDDLPGAAPEPQGWLNTSFVKIDNIKSISLVSTNGGNLWTILREAESRPWSLSDAKSDQGEPPDTMAVSHIAEILPFLTFADVLPNGSQTAAGLVKPMMLFVETFDRFFYTLKIAGPVRERAYLLSVAVKADISEGADNAKELRDKLAREQAFDSWVYVVESATIEPLLRDRSQLLQKKGITSQETFAPLQLSERHQH